MTTTKAPPHAVVLLDYLRATGPVTFTDTGLFECWRETGLEDLEIISALDWLAITNKIVRSNDTLRTEVRVRV